MAFSTTWPPPSSKMQKSIFAWGLQHGLVVQGVAVKQATCFKNKPNTANAYVRRPNPKTSQASQRQTNPIHGAETSVAAMYARVVECVSTNSSKALSAWLLIYCMGERSVHRKIHNTQKTHTLSYINIWIDACCAKPHTKTSMLNS